MKMTPKQRELISDLFGDSFGLCIVEEENLILPCNCGYDHIFTAKQIEDFAVRCAEILKEEKKPIDPFEFDSICIICGKEHKNEVCF